MFLRYIYLSFLSLTLSIALFFNSANAIFGFFENDEITKDEVVQNCSAQDTTCFLSEKDYTSIAANAFTGLSNLQYLDLDGNQITTINQGAFTGLSNLKELYLHDNQITTINQGAFTGLSKLTKLILGFAGSVATLEAKEIFEPHLKEFATNTDNKGQAYKRTEPLIVEFYRGPYYFDPITYTADQINAAAKKSGSDKAPTGKSGKKSKKPKPDNASTGVTSQNTGTKNKIDDLTLPEEKDAYCRCLIKNQDLLNVEENQKKVPKACINKITQKNKDTKEIKKLFKFYNQKVNDKKVEITIPTPRPNYCPNI